MQQGLTTEQAMTAGAEFKAANGNKATIEALNVKWSAQEDLNNWFYYDYQQRHFLGENSMSTLRNFLDKSLKC